MLSMGGYPCYVAVCTYADTFLYYLKFRHIYPYYSEVYILFYAQLCGDINISSGMIPSIHINKKIYHSVRL